LYHAINYRDIIYDFISQYHPPPPQTTAIYRDFKKSTAISKGYNVGLRYINVYSVNRRNKNKGYRMDPAPDPQNIKPVTVKPVK
jgi:hypothetical protein